jgi:hypothetical protein
MRSCATCSRLPRGRSRSVSLLDAAQAIVDGPWRHAARARHACVEGQWRRFIAATSPRAPRLIGRFDHAACVTAAATMCTGPEAVVVDVVPVWACSADECASRVWVAVHAMRIGGDNVCIVESGPHDVDARPSLSHAVTCRARRWRIANVVDSRSYAPDIAMSVRRGAYGVVAGDVLALDDISAAVGDAQPPPHVEVPPFCTWFEPRVSGVDGDVVAAIRAQSVTVDDNGNWVQRPT